VTRSPLEAVREAQVLGQCDGVNIRPEEVVIELFEPHTRLELETCG
jgi:hypothetical protein